MPTFRESYCARSGCPEAQFTHRVFWHCLHGHARWLAPLVVLVDGEYFAPDRELIAVAGRASNMGQLNTEIRDYVMDPRNTRWWRRRAKVRLSTQRLRSLARDCFGQSAVETSEIAGRSR